MAGGGGGSPITLLLCQDLLIGIKNVESSVCALARTQLSFEPFYFVLETSSIVLNFIMMLLKRNNFVTDHIHGYKDFLFVFGKLDTINLSVSCAKGSLLLVVYLTVFNKDRYAILR